MKRFLAGIFACIFLTSSFSFAAPTAVKSETVYVTLDYYGSADEINVFNDYITNGQESITDYGTYESLSNLTNKEDAITDGTGVTWNTSGLTRFAYTGKINNENYKNIPWNIKVNYKLNGVPEKAENLLGKSGLVEIAVDINSNIDANSYYRNNYMLEVTGSFDMDNYLSLEADEAMLLETGRTKTLMFIVLPGQSTTLNIKIGSNYFEFDGITFAMVPVEGELLEKIGDIVKDKEDFEDAMKAVNNSTDVMLNAFNNMTPSLKQINSGISQVQDGTGKIHNLSTQRNENITQLKDSLVKMQGVIKNTQTDLDNLKKGASNLTSMMEEIQPKIEDMILHMNKVGENFEDLEKITADLPDTIDEMKDTLNTAQNLISNTTSLLNAQKNARSSEMRTNIAAITTNLEGIANIAYTTLGKTPEMFATMSEEEKVSLAMESPEKANAVQILSNLKNVGDSFTDLKIILDDGTVASDNMTVNLRSMRAHLGEFEDMLDEEAGKAIDETVTNLKLLVKKLNDMLEVASKYNQKFIESKEDIPTAIENLKEMVMEFEKMDVTAIRMISNLQTSLAILDNQIYIGTDSVATGLKDVTNKLTVITDESGNMKGAKNKARDIVKNKWEKIDEETTVFNIDTKAKPISFSSEKNESPSKVQFMLRIPEIKEIKDNLVDLEKSKENIGFWQRFIAIFQGIIEWIKGLLTIDN